MLEIQTVSELAASMKFGESSVSWEFPNAESARSHIRKYEIYLSHWGYQCKAEKITIKSMLGEEWAITPANRTDVINPEVSPLNSFRPENDDPDYLAVAEQRLSAPLVKAMVGMQENPGIKGIVKWESQKQVILTKDCTKVGIGNSLEECFNFSRYQYWSLPDLDTFIQRCAQELRSDGSNSMEYTYLTYDPTTNSDWIKITAKYHMIDAGRMGVYQFSENLDYSSVLAPV